MNSKTRIAYVLTPIAFGGSEKVALTYLRSADRSRFEIEPVLLTRPWEPETIFVQELRKLRYSFHTIPVATRPSREGKDYLRVLRCLKLIYAILKKGSFDLVHTHGYFADIIGTPTAKILGRPHLSSCHGFISNDRNLKLYNMLDCFSLRFCDRIIAVSEGIRDDLIHHGIRPSKIVVIPNAVHNLGNSDDLLEVRLNMRKSLGIEADEYVAGYVGRLSDEKGIQYLIEAGSILKGRCEPFRILIIGDGPKRKELETLTLERGLEREITFTGFQRDVEHWLPVLDIFVLPSLTEGTPMALLEAMAAGIPAVATSVGGVPTIIEDGANGILIDPADSKMLADTLTTLAHDPSASKQMAERAIATIESEYSVDQWLRRVEAQYDLLSRTSVEAFSDQNVAL